jgi:topoisomerase-4 subunit A
MTDDNNQDIENPSGNDEPQPGNSGSHHEQENIVPVSGMYREWFLDYASYVILERAVPALDDGLKPVQRRIMHAMWELDDGRYNKVANVIGHTMKYHPHGDASIGDALVQLGQKELLIDTQGNWGNILTGDGAAAPRYIEARLSKFALEVVFNPKTTQWLASYDGRNKEPMNLPIKFPLLLAQGAEGIAVGMACKILPHNFNELIDGSVNILKNKPFELYPDFLTGGMMDAELYNDGLRGGKIRVRARIKQLDKKTLVVEEIPFGTNTTSLIESILKAADAKKINIRKIEDNTSEFVEILIHLDKGVSPDKTIDALYAFTDCEISISPNASVILNDKPLFLGVADLLKHSTHRTVDLLKLELEIKLNELQEAWHFASLEKIFIEKRIYRDIEEEETWEGVIQAIHKGLKPYIKHLKRVVTDEDVARLTEIRIKRISRFDINKAEEEIARLEGEIQEVLNHLANLIEYAIRYFKHIKEKYGKGKERRTEIRKFDTIQARKVIVANKKLYVDYVEGFIGWDKKIGTGEPVSECSDIDDIIIFREDGVMQVVRIADKKFVGKNILFASVWKKNDDRTIYHLIYRDGRDGAQAMVKRFAVSAITREKEYDLTKGTAGSKVLYLSVNPDGRKEVVTVHLKPRPNLRKTKIDFDFSELQIKGRAVAGNRLTREKVIKVMQKEIGGSTLDSKEIWFDDSVKRINDEGRGNSLGQFKGEDKILTIYKSGNYRLTGFDVSTHFEDDVIHIEKWIPAKPISAVYFDGEKKKHFVKRFLCESASDKPVLFISETPGSRLELASTLKSPVVQVQIDRKEKDTGTYASIAVDLSEFIDIKGQKAVGNQLDKDPARKITLLPDESEDWEPEDFPDLSDLILDEIDQSVDTAEVDSQEGVPVQKKEPEFEIIIPEEEPGIAPENDKRKAGDDIESDEDSIDNKEDNSNKPANGAGPSGVQPSLFD